MAESSGEEVYSESSVISGVPQRSMLRLLLFVMPINYLDVNIGGLLHKFVEE